jgi:hypothetical protein
MAVAPLLLTAGSALYSADRSAAADKYNAAVMSGEQAAAVNQGAAAEGMVRRESAMSFGKQTAAFGGAGVGYAGSTAVALKQSAVSQELDALNTRYKAAFTGYGYGVESGILKNQGDETMMAGGLLAGARALKSLSGSYSTYDPGQAVG